MYTRTEASTDSGVERLTSHDFWKLGDFRKWGFEKNYLKEKNPKERETPRKRVKELEGVTYNATIYVLASYF